MVDIVTIPLSTKGLAALMADGTVRTAGLESYFDAETIVEIEAWTDLVQLDASMGDYFGLKADGSVVSTMHDDTLTDPFDPNHWTNVKELLANEYGYFALTKDGRVLVWNDYPDASFGGGKVYQSWTKVEKLCYYAYPEARGMCGLRADGIVEAAALSTESWRADEIRTEMEQALAWRDIAALASTELRLLGLKKDGSIAVGGTAHFGTEEKADWSGWTGVSSIQAGHTLGGEYLIGLKGKGVVTKGAALSAVAYGAPRKVVQAACSGYQALFLEQDGTVSSLGFPGVKSWTKIRSVYALDGLALGLREDGTVAVEVLEGCYPEEEAEQIRSWEHVRTLCTARDGLVIGVTEGGQDPCG